MEYIDEEIISYERILRGYKRGTFNKRKMNRKNFECRIYNEKTNTNRTYNIKLGEYYIYREKPQKFNLQYIIIETFDDLYENGYHVEKISITYNLTNPYSNIFIIYPSIVVKLQVFPPQGCVTISLIFSHPFEVI